MRVKEQIQKISQMLHERCADNSEAKERIHQKAKELFCTCGIRSITMDELAKQLGISKKTIYQSYGDKDALVADVFERSIEEKLMGFLINSSNADNSIHELFLNWNAHQEFLHSADPFIMHDLEKNHPNVYGHMKSFLNVEVLKITKENIERGIKEELYRNEIDAELMARYRIASLGASMNNEFFPKNKFNMLDLERQLLLHFMHGIATAKGVKMIQKYFK